MHHVQNQASLALHENVIQFFGFCYSKRFVAILMANADSNLIDRLKMMDQSADNNQPTFINFFIKLTLNIINGMVRDDQSIPLKNYTILQIYINENEIVHRNLKADNILIAENDIAKVCDTRTTIFSYALPFSDQWFWPVNFFHQQFVHKLFRSERSFIATEMDGTRSDCRPSIFGKKRCVSTIFIKMRRVCSGCEIEPSTFRLEFGVFTIRPGAATDRTICLP